MKSIAINCLIVVLMLSEHSAKAQNVDESLSDQFSLQGALDLFRQSASPENFEELLNKPDNAVNNLDLNNDGEVDYIRVIDNRENDVHALILQAQLSENKNQDVAVIAIEKTGAENAILQIIGDEDVFGKRLIAEPYGEKPQEDAFVIDNVNNGPFAPVAGYSVKRIVVNVWFWPSVRFIFGARYTVWISPYRWGRMPGWYRPWKTIPYSLRPGRVHNYPSYVIVDVNRIPRAHRIYREYRKGYYRDRYRGRANNYYRGNGSRRNRR